MATIQIQINGEQRQVERGLSVADLLRLLGLDRRACAVEVNQMLVPKARHASQPVSEGDRLEIVSLVGGG